MDSIMNLTQLAVDLETQVWKAVVEKDGSAISRLFDDNYIEVTLEGQRVEKAEVVASSPQIDDIHEYRIESPKIISFDGHTLLLNYHLTIDGTIRGAAIEPRERWATSIWSNRSGRWSCSFFQQSPFQQQLPSETKSTFKRNDAT